jgi:hypothetical protein
MILVIGLVTAMYYMDETQTTYLVKINDLAYEAALPLANVEGDPVRRRTMVRIMTEEILTSFIP